MRKPDTIEWLYLDFDGFFASVEQQIQPALRGRPVGVVPFGGTDHTILIACSKEAKARGVKNIMSVRDARKKCPDILLVVQKPDYYRRAHNALCSAIHSVIPIDARKSIDELTCALDRRDIADPTALTRRIKRAIIDDVGAFVTCSIGYAANRHLAKIACKMDKPDGETIWSPDIMPGPLLPVPFDDIPGIGGRMQARLWRAGISTTPQLLATQPKQMRKLWGHVTGERLWYALHGYDIKALPSEKGMYGHGRVLPPEMRSRRDAFMCSRLLLVKAARRMRRDKYYAKDLHIWIVYRPAPRVDKSWSGKISLYQAHDDQACLSALTELWKQAGPRLQPHYKIIRVGVWMGGLVPADGRQLDLLHNDDDDRKRWERVTQSMDALNRRYGRSVVTLGPWSQKYGDHLGTKIAFTRVPSIEDQI